MILQNLFEIAELPVSKHQLISGRLKLPANIKGLSKLLRLDIKVKWFYWNEAEYTKHNIIIQIGIARSTDLNSYHRNINWGIQLPTKKLTFNCQKYSFP